MPQPVVNGALLICACGAMPCPLVVTSQQQAFIENQLVGTIMDYTMANIATFGVCATLTAAASGVPAPCALSAPAPWAPGSATSVINNFPVLLNTDTLQCAVGGVISVLQPGEMTVMDT